jgi:hypothetical protein
MPVKEGWLSAAPAGAVQASSADDAAQIQAFEPREKDAIGPGLECRAALEHFTA